MNPMDVIGRGTEDYLISIALMEKAMKLQNDRKKEEIQVQAELTGLEVAKVLAKIF